MAKPVPIPSLKKPSNALPVDAMAAFVSGPDSAGAVASPELVALTSVPSSDEVSDTSTTVVSIESGRVAPPRAKTVSKKSGRRVETRADGSVSRKVTVYLEPELDKQLSIHAVTNDVDRSDIVAEALSRYLQKAAR